MIANCRNPVENIGGWLQRTSDEGDSHVLDMLLLGFIWCAFLLGQSPDSWGNCNKQIGVNHVLHARNRNFHGNLMVTQHWVRRYIAGNPLAIRHTPTSSWAIREFLAPRFVAGRNSDDLRPPRRPTISHCSLRVELKEKWIETGKSKLNKGQFPGVTNYK